MLYRVLKTHREMNHSHLEHPPDGRGNEGQTRASWLARWNTTHGSVFVTLCDVVLFVGLVGIVGLLGQSMISQASGLLYSRRI